MIEAALERHARTFFVGADSPAEYDRGGLREALVMQFLVSVPAVLDAAATPGLDSIAAAVVAEGEETFRRKLEYLADFGRTIGIPEVESQVLSQVMLNVLDEKWKDHLYDLDQLRNAIQYRAYGQRDPLVEYKKEAFDMFEDLVRDIQTTFTERFLKIQVSAEPEPPRRMAPPPPVPVPAPAGPDDLFNGPAPRAAPAPAPRPAVASSLGRLGAEAPIAADGVGRNDPCPCGSGKKYKKCHGIGK